jgi:hypothetical protein
LFPHVKTLRDKNNINKDSGNYLPINIMMINHERKIIYYVRIQFYFMAGLTKTEWEALKKSHGNKCLICGVPDKDGKFLEKAHLVAKSKGGSQYVLFVQVVIQNMIRECCLQLNSTQKIRINTRNL